GADITDNVQAQKALEASEQRYRELVEDVTDILYTLDQDGCFLSLSRSFERITGYSTEEWIGRPFAELVRSCSLSPAIDSLREAAAGDHRVIREYDVV